MTVSKPFMTCTDAAYISLLKMTDLNETRDIQQYNFLNDINFEKQGDIDWLKIRTGN
jgi:hypothetical protein